MKIYNTTIKQLIDYLTQWPVNDTKYQVEITPQTDDAHEGEFTLEHHVSVAPEHVTNVSELVQLIQAITADVFEMHSSLFTTTIGSEVFEIMASKSQTPYLDKYKHTPDILERKIQSSSSDVVDKVVSVMQLLTNRRVENNFVNCVLEDVSGSHGKLSSVTRQIDDKMCVVINTGTRKFDSVSGNQLLFALHVAECIFREVLYNEQGQVDIQQLDELLDVFYDLMFKNLENTLNN